MSLSAYYFLKYNLFDPKLYNLIFNNGCIYLLEFKIPPVNQYDLNSVMTGKGLWFKKIWVWAMSPPTTNSTSLCLIFLICIVEQQW